MQSLHPYVLYIKINVVSIVIIINVAGGSLEYDNIMVTNSIGISQSPSP